MLFFIDIFVKIIIKYFFDYIHLNYILRNYINYIFKYINIYKLIYLNI